MTRDDSSSQPRRLSRSWRAVLWPILMIVPALGCATLRGDPGSETRSWSGALVHAVSDPWTWAPLSSAVVIEAGGWDGTISSWARRNTPVFGSRTGALWASDRLLEISRAGMVVTALGVPAETRPLAALGQRILVELGAGMVTESATHALKRGTARLRPDGSNYRSFPSGHSSVAFSYGAMGSRNLAAFPQSTAAARVVWRSIAPLTAWARVEGGVHYPTDVLVGAALGNAVAVFLHDAVLGPSPDHRLSVSLDRDGGVVSMHVGYP